MGGLGGAGGDPGCVLATDCASPLVCKQGSCIPAASWTFTHDGPSDEVVSAIAAASDGTVLAVGYDTFQGDTPFVRFLDGAGSVLASPALATSGGNLDGAAFDAGDNGFVSGRFSGMVTFPDSSSQTSNSTDIVFMEFANDQSFSCGNLLGGADLQTGLRAAAGGGNVFFAGEHETTVDLGLGSAGWRCPRRRVPRHLRSGRQPVSSRGPGGHLLERQRRAHRSRRRSDGPPGRCRQPRSLGRSRQRHQATRRLRGAIRHHAHDARLERDVRTQQRRRRLCRGDGTSVRGGIGRQLQRDTALLGQLTHQCAIRRPSGEDRCHRHRGLDKAVRRRR